MRRRSSLSNKSLGQREPSASVYAQASGAVSSTAQDWLVAALGSRKHPAATNPRASGDRSNSTQSN